jgi:hypothetical protein
MAEKRSAHRIAVRLRACFRSSGAVIEGWVLDLSRRGLFLRSEYLDEPGATGSIDLELPDGENLRLPAEVVRVDTTADRAGMAIRFGALDDDARRPLANFMIESSYQALR